MNLNFRGNQLVPKLLPKDVNQKISMENDIEVTGPQNLEKLVEDYDIDAHEAIKNEYAFRWQVK